MPLCLLELHLNSQGQFKVIYDRLIRVAFCKTVFTEKQMAQSNRSSSKRMCLKAVQERTF